MELSAVSHALVQTLFCLDLIMIIYDDNALHFFNSSSHQPRSTLSLGFNYIVGKRSF
jgi:hypothetical protein